MKTFHRDSAVIITPLHFGNKTLLTKSFIAVYTRKIETFIAEGS